MRITHRVKMLALCLLLPVVPMIRSSAFAQSETEAAKSSAVLARVHILDDFEDGDLVSRLGSQWVAFDKSSAANSTMIPLSAVPSEGGGYAIQAKGALPEDGTEVSWGGFYLDLSADGSQERDLTRLERLSFDARTDDPGIYLVRIEDGELRENSTNILFPVDFKSDSISISLWRFSRGSRRAVRLTFSKPDQRPGDLFNLTLDNVRLETATARAGMRLEEAGIPWAPSVTTAWETACSRQQPLLMYFTSDSSSRCASFEEEALAQGRFAELASHSTLALLDVSADMELSRRYGVIRVPCFVVINPANRQSMLLDPMIQGSDWAEELRTVAQAFKTEDPAKPTPTPVAMNTGLVTLVDDFSDVNFANRVGGTWETFSRGDQGDILRRFVLLESGNFAIEAVGRLPAADDGATWGGIYCDLSAGRRTPRNLAYYEMLEFTAASRMSGRFAVRLENGTAGTGSTLVFFNAGPSLQRYRIPLSQFSTGIDQALCLVWVPADPLPGRMFHLVIDDVAFTRR